MMKKTKAPKKPISTPRRQKADNPEQYERFREFAREVEADDDLEAFDRRFRKIVPPKKKGSVQSS